MNKENMGERPSRSILKNDTTLPLLPSTNRLNRRVSFHPEVTLHKINFVPVPVDKRRETIAIIPLLRDNSDSGNSSIESKEDTNSTTSDDNPIGTSHENADDNLGGNSEQDYGNNVDEDSDDDLANFENNADEGEEETMELTGQFVADTKAKTTKTRDNEVGQGDASDATNIADKIDTFTKLQHKGVSVGSTGDNTDLPPYYLDEGEGDMELTSNIGLNHQNIVKLVGNDVNSEKLNAEQPEQDAESHGISHSIPEINRDQTSATNTDGHLYENSMDIFASANGHNNLEYNVQVNNDEGQLIQRQNENELEETMDITKFYSEVNVQSSTSYLENDQFNQEITMDITKLYNQENRLELINEMPDSDAEPIMQYNEGLRIPENESIMEFTQEIGKINISDGATNNRLGNIHDQEFENEINPTNENVEQHQEEKEPETEQPQEPDSKEVISGCIDDETHSENGDTNKDEAYRESENLGNDTASDAATDVANATANDTANNTAKQVNEINELHLDNDNEQFKQEQNTNISSRHDTTLSMNETNKNTEKDTHESTSMELTQIEQDSESQEPATTDIYHEIDQQSQKMQLTQEYGEIKQIQLKRTIDEVESIPHKYPKIDNNNGINKTITTTIPLADISTESNDDDDELEQNYIPVSLNDFLKDISIRFYDDLEIGIKSVDRISISLPKINGEENYKFDEFVTAMNKMPLLELYDFSCKELTKNIKDGTILFEQFNQFTMENNPRLFKQYYLSSPNEKLSMKSEFQLIKDYTRLQAKEVWYGWRTQLIKNLIIQLDEKHDTLVHDRLLLLENLKLINGIHEQLKDKFDNLSNQLNQLLQIEKNCNDLDSSDLFSLRNELTVACKQFKENQQNQALQNKELNKLNSIISDNKALINAFTDEINDVEKSLNRNKKYEFSEIELLKLKFNFLQSFTNLNYKYMKDSKLAFNFVGVEVAMDFKDIYDLSNISYSVDQNSSTPFNNSFITTNIAPKLFNMITGSTIIESFQAFKKHWSVLKSIDEDIYAISWKLPVVFIESQDDVMNFKIRYYCCKHNFKVELFVSIDLSNLLDYPNNFQIRGQLIKSDTEISQQIILTNLLNDCVHTALVNKDKQIVIDGL